MTFGSMTTLVIRDRKMRLGLSDEYNCVLSHGAPPVPSVPEPIVKTPSLVTVQALVPQTPLPIVTASALTKLARDNLFSCTAAAATAVVVNCLRLLTTAA